MDPTADATNRSVQERLRAWFRGRNGGDDRNGEDLGEGRGIVSAYLFGSHAAGHPHRESDVDVAVLLDRDRFPTARERFDQRLRLTAELISVLHCNDVDLLVLNDVPPLLGRRIVYEGQRLHCSDPAADRRFLRDVQLRAADLEPWLRRMQRRKLEALAR